MIEFTIADEADQLFSTILNDQRVTIRLRYNEKSDRWSFDLSVDDLPVLLGVRIVTETDLLDPYNLGLGVLFAVPSNSEPLVPDRANLPSGLVRVYHASDAEVAEALS